MIVTRVCSLLLIQLLSLALAEKFFTKARVDPISWASGLPTVVPLIRTLEICSLYCYAYPDMCVAFEFLDGTCSISTTTTFFKYSTSRPEKTIWYNSGAGVKITTKTIDTLNTGDFLRFGDYLVSKNGCFNATTTSDGNLVVYKISSNSVLWSTTFTGQTGKAFSFIQQDGNFIQTDGNGGVLKAWNTYTNIDAYVYLQGDGNLLVLNSKGGVLSATNVYTTC